VTEPVAPNKHRDLSDPQRHQDRAIFLASVLVPSVGKDPLKLASVADRLMVEMDPPTIKRLHRRYFSLSEQDLMSFNHLRDDGAHRSVLLQFLAATQTQALDDSPSRDKVYRDFQERRARQKAHRPFEIAVRVATPVLFVTTCALVLPWAVSKGMAAAGVGAALTKPALAVLDPIAGPVVDLVMQETGGWLARAGLAVGAWVGWGYAARVLPDLKSTFSQAETQALDKTLGPAQKNWQLHAALRKIPHADRHLLAHLLPTELRAFLRGNDKERKDILIRQPPPLMAEVMSVLATHPPGVKNFFRAVRDLGDLCLPEAWRKGWLRNPLLDTDTRLAKWRASRTETAAAVVPDAVRQVRKEREQRRQQQLLSQPKGNLNGPRLG
jgi:hypothetical protein